jgi:uncharacterized damage-inducible protein DinB
MIKARFGNGFHMMRAKAGNESLQLIRELYHYNSRTRKRYLKTIFRNVPAKDRYRDMGASFPSIVDIFIHIIDACRFWFLFVCCGNVEEKLQHRGELNALLWQMGIEPPLVEWGG